MARRAFFSFDYGRDHWRVSQVRDSWVKNPDMETAGFTDPVSWEHLKWDGEKSQQKWIDREMERSSVIVVLIGSETSSNDLVDYAIRQSRSLGKALFGIYIHNLKDKDGNTDLKGKNPFDNFCFEQKGEMVHLSRIYPAYDWLDDDGPNNFAQWFNAAVRKTVTSGKPSRIRPF
jgi:hypothetical protein